MSAAENEMLQKILDAADPQLYDVETSPPPGPQGSLPLTDEMLAIRPAAICSA